MSSIFGAISLDQRKKAKPDGILTERHFLTSACCPLYVCIWVFCTGFSTNPVQTASALTVCRLRQSGSFCKSQASDCTLAERQPFLLWSLSEYAGHPRGQGGIDRRQAFGASRNGCREREMAPVRQKGDQTLD